jgi:hypothetical protein
MDSKLSPWLPAIAAVAGTSTFAATVVAYFDRHRTGMPGSYAPFIAGTLLFVLIVGAASYSTTHGGASRVWRTAIASILAAACFGFALLFVLLNTLGS